MTLVVTFMTWALHMCTTTNVVKLIFTYIMVGHPTFSNYYTKKELITVSSAKVFTLETYDYVGKRYKKVRSFNTFSAAAFSMSRLSAGKRRIKDPNGKVKVKRG